MWQAEIRTKFHLQELVEALDTVYHALYHAVHYALYCELFNATRRVLCYVIRIVLCCVLCSLEDRVLFLYFTIKVFITFLRFIERLISLASCLILSIIISS